MHDPLDIESNISDDSDNIHCIWETIPSDGDFTIESDDDFTTSLHQTADIDMANPLLGHSLPRKILSLNLFSSHFFIYSFLPLTYFIINLFNCSSILSHSTANNASSQMITSNNNTNVTGNLNHGSNIYDGASSSSNIYASGPGGNKGGGPPKKPALSDYMDSLYYILLINYISQIRSGLSNLLLALRNSNFRDIRDITTGLLRTINNFESQGFTTLFNTMATGLTDRIRGILPRGTLVTFNFFLNFVVRRLGQINILYNSNMLNVLPTRVRYGDIIRRISDIFRLVDRTAKAKKTRFEKNNER